MKNIYILQTPITPSFFQKNGLRFRLLIDSKVQTYPRTDELTTAVYKMAQQFAAEDRAASKGRQSSLCVPKYALSLALNLASNYTECCWDIPKGCAMNYQVKLGENNEIPLPDDLCSCVFRFVRPPVPVSSGQAFRCDPASMI